MDSNNPIETPTPVPPSTQTLPPTPQVPAQSKPSVELKNSSGTHKSHTGLYVVIAVIAVLAALIGGAFWYLNMNQKQVAPQTAVVNTTKPAQAAQPTPEDFKKEVNNLNVDEIDTSDIDKDLDKLQ
jgi:uncharacterized protein HemX